MYRYCPSIEHLKLLLALLSKGKEGSAQNVSARPALVILWNVGGMLMETDEANENEKSAILIDDDSQHRPRGKRFRRE